MKIFQGSISPTVLNPVRSMCACIFHLYVYVYVYVYTILLCSLAHFFCKFLKAAEAPMLASMTPALRFKACKT